MRIVLAAPVTTSDPSPSRSPAMRDEAWPSDPCCAPELQPKREIRTFLRGESRYPGNQLPTRKRTENAGPDHVLIRAGMLVHSASPPCSNLELFVRLVITPINRAVDGEYDRSGRILNHDPPRVLAARFSRIDERPFCGCR